MATEKKAVDFTNPEAVEAELTAAAAEDAAKKEAPKKARKPAKPRVIKVSYTADRDIKKGEVIEFDYEVPRRRRGIVAGIPLDKMTDDQLRIEYRNANSVFYKTRKAGRDATKAEARLDRCKAEMAKRGIQPSSRRAVKVDAAAVANLIKSGAITVEEIQKMLDAE